MCLNELLIECSGKFLNIRMAISEGFLNVNLSRAHYDNTSTDKDNIPKACENLTYR